jgi:hypothetical protein
MMLIEDAGSNQVQPANDITDPARRWEHLIPLTALMFALAVPGVFLLPAHPHIELYLHIWMLATITLFFFLRYQVRKMRSPVVEQVSKTRTLTGYEVATYQPDDSGVPKRAMLVSDLSLRMGGLMVIVAEVQLLALAIEPYFHTYPSTSVNIVMAAISLMMAVLCIAIFSVTLLIWRERPERGISGRSAFYGVLSTFIVIFSAVTFLAFQVPRYIFVGPPAPWPMLLAFAQGQAERIDKDAVMRLVSARPPYDASRPYSSKDTVLEVHFTFYVGNTRNIDVIVLDVDPPRLLSATSHLVHTITGGSSDELQAYRERAALIKLSPREVYALTEEEGLAFGTEKNSRVSPSMNIDVVGYLQKPPVEPASWNVTYLADQSPSHPSLFLPVDSESPSHPSLFLRVDSATGKVVTREHWPEDLEKKAMPVPSVSPTVTP